jgi:hypothetical protein
MSKHFGHTMITGRGAALVSVAALALAACQSRQAAVDTNQAASPPAASASPASSASALTITATEFAFDAPAEVPSGITTIDLVNKGQQFHHLVLMQLTQGKTMDDFTAAMKKPGPPPSWLVGVGGPIAAPGSSGQATVKLVPGNYVMMCVVPGPDHVPHIAKGMVRALTVTDVQSAANVVPGSDLTLALSDFAYSFSAPPTAGTHTFRVTNTGKQDHEAVLLRLAPGKGPMDFAKWVDNQTGPPPGELGGGTTEIAPGADAYFTANLTPGHYALVCFVPDAADGKPHIVKGMMKEFTI